MEIYESKRQAQHEQSTKSSRSPTPESAAVSLANGDSFRPIVRTPPPSRTGPPPSPPVPTHPVAPVAPEPSAPLPLMPCLVCGRTFVPQSLAKHVKICEKMTVKKRKTFDSSRQRREGTDLEQYLPKNFGLPENSPFLEKSSLPTSKPAAKPKTQSVRSAIMKPMAELQRCPHCGRAFGVRAFERHVEWCADKAKILPAAPAQPPQHIADAKQRLNARTQYKAPPVRGRRSSQSRDKSNSRSASVDSSRGVSPAAPREAGDHRRGRTRASESGSSNDCHEETSAHMPVIRNTRNTQNSSSGDANVKARQARLARDLSSSRNDQNPRPSSIQQSNTDPNIKKVVVKNKPKNKLNARKQQHLKKLEEIANKYSDKDKEHKDDVIIAFQKRERSQIPILKSDKKKQQEATRYTNTIKRDIKGNETKAKSDKLKKDLLEALSEISLNNKNNISYKEVKVKGKKVRETIKIVKESTMSLDSLEEWPQNSGNERNRQSVGINVGINTELLCIPCVIHENLEQRKSARKDEVCKITKEIEFNLCEPKVEILYKNPIMAKQQKLEKYNNHDQEVLAIANYSNSLITPSTSDNFVSDSIDSMTNFHNCETAESMTNLQNLNNVESNKTAKDNCQNNEDFIHEKSDVCHDLSTEHFEIDCERDRSAEFNYSENKSEDGDINDKNEIEYRHGSGETYTKFTEDPGDLEEFMNITDKLINNNTNEVENFHTPATNSIEAINQCSLDDVIDNDAPKHKFSDTFEELKYNLTKILDASGDINDVIKKTNETLVNENTENNSDTARNICDMEHITVYELKFYEKQPKEQNITYSSTTELRLPSITESNKPGSKIECNKKRMQKLYKPSRKYRMLGEHARTRKEYQTFIIKQCTDENSDGQSVSSDAPPLKLPRIEVKRLDDNYDPFVSAARQMKELMSSDTNIPQKIKNSQKDAEKHRTLPTLQPAKEKNPSSFLRSNNTKMIKDTLNKTYQKTPTLQRMKSFGSTSNENSSNSFGGRCSSFRLNRNDRKSNPKLNTTFNKSSKENISVMDKNYFNRNNNLNRSFSSYTASSCSTPKPKDKIPKIATSMYHSFQRSSIKQPVKLDKIKRDDERKDFVNLDAILADDNSSMTDSSYIDPRLINENDNLPINVKTILNNPDIISSMESLLTTENLPAKFESFSCVTHNNNSSKVCNNNNKGTIELNGKIESKNNVNKTTAPTADDLSMQYKRLMHSLEQSITSKTSVRDDESLCEDFDLEEFMTSFDEEIHKHKSENKRICSSTTRIVKQSQLADSNRASELSSISSSPKVRNGMIPVNKSMSLNFSSNNVVSENLFPSSVKRSTSLLDSIQKRNVQKTDSMRSRHKTDQLEQDIMQSLKDFDKFYESEKIESQSNKETFSYNGTSKRDARIKPERKTKKRETGSNDNYTPNGKTSNDSAYSSLNRISPSKLSVCATKEQNGLPSLEQIPAGSDSGASHKEDARSISSEEFLAMERSAELDDPLPLPDVHPYKEPDSQLNEKRASSRASSRRSGYGASRAELSSSGSEASLHRAPVPRASRYCHECGNRFPVDTAKFCIECGVKRLVL